MPMANKMMIDVCCSHHYNNDLLLLLFESVPVRIMIIEGVCGRRP